MGLELQPAKFTIATADGTAHPAKGYIDAPVEYAGKVRNIPLLVIPSITKKLILGMDFWTAFQIAPTMSPLEEEREACVVNEGFGEFGVVQVSALEMEGEEEKITALEDSHKLTEVHMRELEAAIEMFRFSSDSELGYTTLLEHGIDTGLEKPIRQRSFLVSPYLQEEINKEVDRMLALGVIEPASSPWSNPMVAVRKPNGKLRYCLDARKLNNITVPEAYPMQDLNRILSRLKSTNYLSSIDLSDAFWQVGLKKEDQPKTAFAVSGRGFFMFIRMPFGLRNSPATLARLVEMVIGCDLEPWVFKYMDDIIVATDTFARHIWVLHELAKRLREAGLTVSITKSFFCMKKIRYVGYLLNEEGLGPDPGKTSAVLEFPAPRNIRETRRFMGMAGWYRRFLPNFAVLTGPITDLLKENRRFEWTRAAQLAFEALKRALVEAPILANPDFALPFTIQTDASDSGVGAVLTQGEGPCERVIAYFSKKISPAQQRYMVTERECLAVILAIEKFRPYIEGVHFTVITDHASLCWLQNLKDPAGRLARWALRLQAYDFKMIHRPGKQMLVPDALSRSVAIIDFGTQPTRDADYLALRQKIQSDPGSYPKFRLENQMIYFYNTRGAAASPPGWRILVPADWKDRVLHEHHEQPTAAHGAFYKTLGRIRAEYFWTKMQADIRQFVRNCVVCKTTKATNENQRALMGKSRNPDRPWRTISLDFMGPFPLSKRGYRFLLVIVDTFSKYCLLWPLRSATAQLTINFLKEQVFLRFGVPEVIILDNGSQLRAKLFKEFADNYRVRLWYNANYHPQANPTEAANCSIINAIKAYIRDDLSHKEWDSRLAEIAAALNSSPHTATEYPPHMVLYGDNLILNGDAHRIRMDGPDLGGHFERLSQIRERVQNNLERAYTRREKQYNLRARPITYKVGDVVYRRNFRQSDAGRGYMAKLAPRYLPARILERVGTNCYRLEDASGKPIEGTWSTSDLRS